MDWSTQIIPTRENVLKKFSEIEIFNWYMGTSLTEDSYFCSPLRKDSRPTCNFYQKNGRLRMIDRRGDFHGDCFDLVMQLTGCSFHAAIKKIWRDMNGKIKPPLPEKTNDQETSKTHKTILVKRKKWDLYTLEYWERYHIPQAVLEKYNVYPLEVVWIGSLACKQNEVARWSDSDPVFGYNLGPGEWKIYRPLAKKGKKFFGNTNILQGLAQLDNPKYLVITKSLKDVMVLSLFNIPAIAPHSEGIVLRDLDKLLELFSIVFIFFDNDWPGKRATVRYVREGCMPLLLKSAKDISDYIFGFGFESTKQLINETKKIFGCGD